MAKVAANRWLKKMGQRDFPTLLTPDTLYERLQRQSNFVILDASHETTAYKKDAKEDFDEKHIPGAQFFDLEECRDTENPNALMLPSPEKFAKYVGKLGIGNDTHVAIYDKSGIGMMSSMRVWWVFRVFGHEKVSVLNGGFLNWMRAEKPVTHNVVHPERQEFKATYRAELVKKFEDMEENLRSKKWLVVDSRPAGRFNGTAPEPRNDIKPGHMPGAVNLPFREILDQETKTIKPVKDLRQIFAKFNVDLDKPIIATCGQGMTACGIALTSHLCGKPDVPVFDGAWMEWFNRAKKEHIISGIE